MLAALEKLLILQDRDRKITLLKAEIASLEPQRLQIRGKALQAHGASDSAKQKLRQLEADRKKLELEVETRKQHIEKYALQQYQTKKNEEYRALSHEIDSEKAAIRKLEDQQLELMELAEAAQKETATSVREAEGVAQETERQFKDLESREQSLRQELARLESDRGQLVAPVDPLVLTRYERLRRTKGDRVIVSVEHSACGGCHVKLPAQVLITSQADQEIAACPNCGRWLYYTRDMNLASAE